MYIGGTRAEGTWQSGRSSEADEATTKGKEPRKAEERRTEAGEKGGQ